MKLIRVNDLVLCLEDETKPPKQSKHYFTIGGKQAADFLMECFNKQQAITPDPLYQAMHDFRDDVLSGIDGLDNDQINAVLSTFDNYMLDDPVVQSLLVAVPDAEFMKWVLEDRISMWESYIANVTRMKANGFPIGGTDEDDRRLKVERAKNLLAQIAAPAKLQGVATRIGVSTCPSDDGKTITVVGMAVQEGVSFVFYTGNHSITQDASGFVDINFQRLMEKK